MPVYPQGTLVSGFEALVYISWVLADGLDGIRRELPLPAAHEENLYLVENQRGRKPDMLPGSLEQALDELESDDLTRQTLGLHVHDRFINAKRAE